MKRSGPDSLNSWLISAACCFINTMLFGMARLAGILFVASIQRFNISRAKASFPYTLLSMVRNISGPLVGFLGHRYGVRAITTFGCLLGAIGAGTCYFAESIVTITVLWGVILGLGYGLGNILLPVSVNQYFDKQRATASGIAFSGACLGSFVLPPIVEILLNTYGLSGTFLFLSGFILNCVPAALLLKKPNFEIKTKQCESYQEKTQSIVPDGKVKLYTIESTGQASQTVLKEKMEVKIGYNEADDYRDRYDLNHTSDEKINIFSTHTHLSDNSVDMRISDPLDSEQIIENSTGRSKEDPNMTGIVNLTFHNTDQDVNCEKDDAFQKHSRSSSAPYEKSVFPTTKDRALSSEYIVFQQEDKIFPSREAYLNYCYNTSVDEDNVVHEFGVHTIHTSTKDVPRSKCTMSNGTEDNCTNYSNLFYSDTFKNYSNSKRKFSKNTEFPDIYNSKIKEVILSSPSEKSVSLLQGESLLGSFSVIFEPMFIFIAVINSLYNFTFVTMVTIIVDFARDLQIGIANEKYVLMALSVGDFIGRLGLGWITDRGYMTTTGFTALCFAIQGISTAAVVMSNGFPMLISLITIYGLAEGGIIIIIPIIIAQYIDLDKQTLAISSCHFLSGPLCLAIAPMIGYFRDNIGAYDFIFYVVAILSAACCFCILLTPYLAKWEARSRQQVK